MDTDKTKSDLTRPFSSSRPPFVPSRRAISSANGTHGLKGKIETRWQKPVPR